LVYFWSISGKKVIERRSRRQAGWLTTCTS
jgi:hypothetical protein